MPNFVTPPPVEPGDQVAVIAPASNAPESARFVYELGLTRMREVFDLEPVEYPTATADPEWLAANPEARAADVMDAFRDPDISAVIANIGGHDQITILPYLDGDVLRAHPTRFYGYSDNTHLALFLWNQGLVSHYGGSTLLEYAMDGEMFDYTALLNPQKTARLGHSVLSSEPLPRECRDRVLMETEKIEITGWIDSIYRR